MKKISLLLTILLLCVMFIPCFSSAKTITAESEDALKKAIEDAKEGDIIELTTNIELTKPIELNDKTIVIDGNGFSVSRNASNWTPNGSNSSLLTAGKSAKLTLINVTLKDSEKYGVQAYNGGYVVLDGVTISNCGYGGVLVNAGTVEVKSLSLGHNGKADSNNGIEIAKGKELSDSDGSKQPKLIMNGVLNSTETKNVVYLASNDNLTEFEVENTANSQDKVFINGNKVVVADKNNNIKFESNENKKIQMEGDTFVPNVTITVNLKDKKATIQVVKGTTLTAKDLSSKIDLKALGLSKYTLDGFFTDAKYTKAFDFKKSIDADTTIYAKLKLTNSSKEKDNTPKTGVENNIVFVLFALTASTIGLITLNRKAL